MPNETPRTWRSLPRLVGGAGVAVPMIRSARSEVSVRWKSCEGLAYRLQVQGQEGQG